jgi:prolyl-tRNA synthetase
MQAANNLYQELTDLGIDTILDDRDISAGNKFKDSDLIGFPIRIVCGKSVQEKSLEIKVRRTGETSIILQSEVIPFIKKLMLQLEQIQ